MTDDPHDLLNEARTIALRRGYTTTGWTLQEDDDGFAAWLYVADGLAERPIPEHVEMQPTALMAAQYLVAIVAALPARREEMEA